MQMYANMSQSAQGEHGTVRVGGMEEVRAQVQR